MAAVQRVVLFCLVRGVAACALHVLRRVCGGGLAERGAVHLAGIVLAAQHRECVESSKEENTKAQKESATAQSSGCGLFGPCNSRKAEEKMWQKKEAREEKRFVWGVQNLRMNGFDMRQRTGMNSENEKKSSERAGSV